MRQSPVYEDFQTKDHKMQFAGSGIKSFDQKWTLDYKKSYESPTYNPFYLKINFAYAIFVDFRSYFSFSFREFSVQRSLQDNNLKNW